MKNNISIVSQVKVNVHNLDHQFKSGLEHLDQAVDQLTTAAEKMKESQGWKELGFHSFKEWFSDRFDSVDSTAKIAYRRQLIPVLYHELGFSQREGAQLLGISRSAFYAGAHRSENKNKYLEEEQNLVLTDGEGLDFGPPLKTTSVQLAVQENLIPKFQKSLEHLHDSIKSLEGISLPKELKVNLAPLKKQVAVLLDLKRKGKQ